MSPIARRRFEHRSSAFRRRR